MQERSEIQDQIFHFNIHRITKQQHTSLAVTPSSEQRLMISKYVYSPLPESVMKTRKVVLNFSVCW